MAAPKSDTDSEAISGVVQLEEDDPLMVEAMLTYLYINKANDFGDWFSEGQPLVHRVQLYAMGEKYSLGGLKRLAEAKSVSHTIIFYLGDGFLEAVKQAYTSTLESGRGLRDIVVRVAEKGIECVREKEGFERMLEEEIPEFALDLFYAVLRHDHRCGNGRYCGNCDEFFPIEAHYCLYCRENQAFES
ncbi:MAG: hypothetical protein M1836_006021 [Candelina mexicana]|nr:MAG: hypothetical protein M1836_006021 [Candelina mexicana]